VGVGVPTGMAVHPHP